MEWINNKVLLYSTQEYIQYPIKSHNGKELIKKNVCVCVYIYIYTHIYIYLNHFAVQQKLTHYKSAVFQKRKVI